MAARFWVGGTGNWDAADTTHWSATSGGSGGASVPGSGDTVTLDGSSGGGTVTMTAGVTVTSITMGAFTGTLDTNGQTVTLSSTFSVTGTATRTLTLGSSTINCTTMVLTSTTNLTFNAGTSTINAAASSITFGTGVGLAFANVTISPTANATINGSNTFSSLTLTGPASKAVSFSLAGNQTVSGTFTANGNSATNRIIIQSSVKGTARTITAATVTVTNADFQDITGAGAGSWNLSAITGGSGDCGGNSGITFTTGATQYWQHGASASYNWSDSTRWFLATNGGGGAGRVPLPQDTARFDANSFAASGKTVVQDMPRIPTTDWTGVTNTPTFTTSTAASFFGSITLVSGLTLTASTQTYTYEGRGSAILTSSGKSWAKAFIVDAVSGTLNLGDAITNSSSLTVQSGAFNDSGFSVTVSNFTASLGTATRVLTMGTGNVWTLTGNNNAWQATATGMTLNPGTATIRLTGALTADRIFNGGGLTYYNLEIATTGAFALQFTGSNTFNNIHIDASAAARTVLFTAGTTTTVGSMTRDAGTNVITLGSITAASHTLTKTGGGTITMDYMSISRSTATPGSTWYATNSTDGGNNSGWIFILVGPVPSIGLGLSLPTASLSAPIVSTTGPTPPIGLGLSVAPAALAPWFLIVSVTAPTGPMGLALVRQTARLFPWYLTPDVVHAMSASLRSEMATGWANLVELCEVDFPDGTLRFAPVPYTSIARGHFDGKVRSYGPVAIVSSDRGGNLGGNETTMEFDDTDRAVGRRIEGAQANNVVGSAVRRYLAAPRAAFADWFLLFEGVITKEPEYLSEFVGTLTARTNDAALGQKTPRQPWTIDQISWPNAHSSALNKPASLVYGSHAASNFQTGPGFIPGRCVDTVGLRWSLAAGRLKSVPAVYIDDVAVVTGWASSYRADRRGRIHTVVSLDAATLLADYGITVDVDQTVVTADVEGYSDGPYGTGSLIAAPADILSHLLSNFVLGDWKNEATWLSTHALIGTSLTSSTGVVKSFLANRQATAAPSYLTWTTGYQTIAEFCDQHGLRAYWLGGKLEFAVEDVAVPPYTGQLLDGDRDVSAMTMAVDDIKVSPAVRVSHVHSAAQEKDLMSFLVTLPELSQDETDELVLLWSPAS